MKKNIKKDIVFGLAIIVAITIFIIFLIIISFSILTSEDSWRNIKYGDAVIITQGFYEGHKGIAIDENLNTNSVVIVTSEDSTRIEVKKYHIKKLLEEN